MGCVLLLISWGRMKAPAFRLRSRVSGQDARIATVTVRAAWGRVFEGLHPVIKPEMGLLCCLPRFGVHHSGVLQILFPGPRAEHWSINSHFNQHQTIKRACSLPKHPKPQTPSPSPSFQLKPQGNQTTLSKPRYFVVGLCWARHN